MPCCWCHASSRAAAARAHSERLASPSGSLGCVISDWPHLPHAVAPIRTAAPQYLQGEVSIERSTGDAVPAHALQSDLSLEIVRPQEAHALSGGGVLAGIR